MEKDKLFAVFGLGIFGFEVCKVLSEKGMKVIAVDKDRKLVDKVKDMVTQAILIDSTDEDALKNADMQDVDVAVVAIGKSVDGSILTTILLKNMGVPRIIARAVSSLHEQVLRQIGATEVVNIAVEEGQRLAKRIISPEMVDLIPLSKNHSIAEVRIPSKFVDKSLQEIDLRKKFHVTLVSVKRMETAIDEVGNPLQEEAVFCPKPDEALKASDILVLLGSENDLQKLKEF